MHKHNKQGSQPPQHLNIGAETNCFSSYANDYSIVIITDPNKCVKTGHLKLATTCMAASMAFHVHAGQQLNHKTPPNWEGQNWTSASRQPHTVVLEHGHGFSDTSQSGRPTWTDCATWPVSPTTQNKRTISFTVNKLSARRGIRHTPGQFHQPVKNKTNPPTQNMRMLGIWYKSQDACIALDSDCGDVNLSEHKIPGVFI